MVCATSVLQAAEGAEATSNLSPPQPEHNPDASLWTADLDTSDSDVEESVRKLVLQQKLQGINEMSDLDSSLLRSQVSDAMLRAIKAEKEKLAQDAYSQKEAPVANRQPKNDAKNGNVSYVHVGVLWFRFPTRVSCSHLTFSSCLLPVETTSCTQQDSEQESDGSEQRCSMEIRWLQCSIRTPRSSAVSTSTSLRTSVVWPLPLSPPSIQWLRTLSSTSQHGVRTTTIPD